MKKRLVILLSDEQHEILTKAATVAGGRLGPWARIVLFNAARGYGLVAGQADKSAGKAEAEAGVAERRDRRNAIKDADAEINIADDQRQAATKARHEIDCRVRDAARMGQTIDLAGEIEEADRIRAVTDAALSAALEKREALGGK